MGIKVKIDDILEGMEFQSNESTRLVNLKTGEVVDVLDEFMRKAEDDISLENLPEWHQEQIELAIDILENVENYRSLPTEFDINEYNMMEEFCFTIKDQRKRDILLQSIRGKGAFRRFKDKSFELDLEQDWYAYRDEWYKQIAVEFCERNNLEYVE